MTLWMVYPQAFRVRSGPQRPLQARLWHPSSVRQLKRKVIVENRHSFPVATLKETERFSDPTLSPHILLDLRFRFNTGQEVSTTRTTGQGVAPLITDPARWFPSSYLWKLFLGDKPFPERQAPHLAGPTPAPTTTVKEILKKSNPAPLGLFPQFWEMEGEAQGSLFSIFHLCPWLYNY